MFNSNDKFCLKALKTRYEKDILFVMNTNLELYSINSSGIEIYNLLKEEYSFEQIINRLYLKYSVPKEQLTEDLYDFIKLLIKYKMLSLKTKE